ncbi:MAG: amidohydrolase family protein [Anaerolineales bacterium]|nr:amidohydrolase family protein [Chloroflexota bacterium]MBL6981507.1 amidohydrolase family protein [Anaerolineales bacterium]
MSKNIDHLLTNAIVLTMDEEFHQYEPGAVAVDGDSIVAVGLEDDLKAKFKAKEITDCGGKVLMPGLVNAHTHAAMTLLRGLADDLRLDVWLLGFMMPVEREFVSPEFVHLGTSLACIEFIRSGITCFADMYYFEEEAAKATAEIGLRALCSQTVLKFPTPDADSYEKALEAAEEYIKRWKGHPLIVPSVAPHAPYTCTEDILQATAQIASSNDVPLHTHLAETLVEVENSQEEHGMLVIPYVEKHNLFDAKVLAAHCVHVDISEIHTLLKHKAGVAHNPSSNLKLASGVAPVTDMLNAGLDVGIGTDGPASNNDLDMFEEVRLAALVAKGFTGDPTVVPAKTALAMATRLGAKALHMGDITGSLEIGKRADLILVDISPLHNAPRFRRDTDGVYAQLVYASKGTDVTDVMVNGQWLMREQELLTVAEEELLQRADTYAKKIDAFLIEREQSVLSKLIAIGGALEQESFEVQVKVRVTDPDAIVDKIEHSELDILHYRHYHEYDTYFHFEDPTQGQLRYREDEFIDENGECNKVRYRLTMIGRTRERHFPSDVLLSRSRFIAPATHSLRFYKEYFKPTSETFIEKDRLRWRVLFQSIEFYINLDRIDQPNLGTFLEVKSRTWSQRDAENKAEIAEQLITFLGAETEEFVAQDYIEFVAEA